MATDIEIAWLAGLLEGEGCFHLNKNSPGIKLSMTDLDVISKASNILGYSLHRIHSANHKYGNKTVHTINYYGLDALKWMKLVRPYMCSRRGSKIDEIINYINEVRPNIESPGLYCRRGHPITESWQYRYHINGSKICKSCERIAGRKRYHTLRVIDKKVIGE